MLYVQYAAQRDVRNLKDADVSKATGISASTFSDWKHSRYSPKVDKLLKIARFFEMSLDELVGGNSGGGLKT